MMNCEQVTRAAGDFIEHRLKLRQRMTVLIHIALCKGCGVYMEQFRLTLLALRSVPQPTAIVPADDLMERFRRESRPPSQ